VISAPPDADTSWGPRLRLALALTALILAVEVTAAALSHSLALLADAGHVLTDVVALGLAWFAVEQSKRPADQLRSYGYHRTGILTAMSSGLVLIAIGVAVVYEAVQRLGHPQPINGGLVLASAGFALAVNAFIASRLRGPGRNLNARAARLHVVGDLAASAGVVVTAIVVLTTGWLYADPVISIGIALLVGWSATRIIWEAVNVLLEGTPAHIDIAAVTQTILDVDGVDSVHDLHVWTLSAEHLALSCHVVMSERSLADGEHAIRALERDVCEQFAIAHTTIQVEQCHPCAADAGHEVGRHNHPHAAV